MSSSELVDFAVMKTQHNNEVDVCMFGVRWDVDVRVFSFVHAFTQRVEEIVWQMYEGQTPLRYPARETAHELVRELDSVLA